MSATAKKYADDDEVFDERFAHPSAEAISKYQLDITQKDELIKALVHELEQAVEKLDRFHRTGSDRSRGGPAMPVASPAIEAFEPPLPLMDDLRRLVEQLEQAQPVSLLVRIESQLAAVHDLVVGLHRRESLGSTEAINRVSSEDRPTLDESPSDWEAIKSKMLNDEPPCQTVENRDDDDLELLKLMSETPTPREVDFGTAGTEELKAAIVERDSFIIQLNRLFRTRNTLSIPVDWATLANVPSDMKLRVESLVERLDVQVRLGEVEMSLERARLARERSQIQSEREHIEKHLRRLGLSSIADLDNISSTTGTAGDRRWMRFLGPNKK